MGHGEGMPSRVPLPADLSLPFSVEQARRTGLGAGRLRGEDLHRPFHGVRAPTDAAQDEHDETDEFAARRRIALERIEAYACRMGPREFFSHESAAFLWGGPVPARWDPLVVHIGVDDDGGLPVARGVRGHRLRTSEPVVTTDFGARVAAPASTWAMLGRWSVRELVMLGDHLCRVWREGHGRTDAGRPPLSTVGLLDAALSHGRRIGAARLRSARDLVRCDSWSPQESACRFHLVTNGLPEPELNVDVHDAHGRFVACVDLAYRRQRIAIEYQGRHHHAQYAADIERIERLRHAGWTVLQVTSALLADPQTFVTRIRGLLLTAL